MKKEIIKDTIKDTDTELVNISNIDIDTLYEYKKQFENASQNADPLELEKFIDDYIRPMKHVFFCGSTQEVIAFNIYKTNEKNVCFHTGASQEAMTAFIEECNAVKWNIPKKQPITEMVDVVSNNKNFFTEC
jgi:hypothetical protein